MPGTAASEGRGVWGGRPPEANTAGSEPVRGGVAGTGIWDSAETLPRERLDALIPDRLRATVARVLAAQPFGAARLAQAGIGSPRDIRSLDDLAAMPFTGKADLRAHYPFGLLAVPRERLARGAAARGAPSNANGYGLFTGGLGFHQGGERIGATVVPVSGGFTARQAMLLRDLGAEVLVSTPSFSLVIAQALADEGIDPTSTPLELGLFGGEPWTDG